MFFSNIAQYSSKKLLILNIIFTLLYYSLILVAPIVTVGIKYAIFENVPAHVKLTGIGLVLFVILGIFGYKKLKQTISKFPQRKISQQRLKFTMETIFSFIPWTIILIAIAFCMDNMNKAFSTLKICTFFIIAANMIDGLFLKYIKCEYELRNSAQDILEVDARKELLRKESKK